MTTALFPEALLRPEPVVMPARLAHLSGNLESSYGKGKGRRRQAAAPDLGPRRPWVYRSKVARALGRPLKPHEIVHHINGDYTDNRLDNLMLLSSQKVHMLLHTIKREQARGVQRFFSLAEELQFTGGRVLWATEVGYRQVFGTSRETSMSN